MSHLVQICYIHREELLLNSVELDQSEKLVKTSVELDQREELVQNSVELDQKEELVQKLHRTRSKDVSLLPRSSHTHNFDRGTGLLIINMLFGSMIVVCFVDLSSLSHK